VRVELVLQPGTFGQFLRARSICTSKENYNRGPHQKTHEGTQFANECIKPCGNTLCALSLLNPPAGIEDAHHQLDTAIANIVYATHCA
jgi:hypothetical protein